VLVPKNPLQRDAYRDVGSRATQEQLPRGLGEGNIKKASLDFDFLILIFLATMLNSYNNSTVCKLTG
jgi:hypothetical protein